MIAIEGQSYNIFVLVKNNVTDYTRKIVLDSIYRDPAWRNLIAYYLICVVSHLLSSRIITLLSKVGVKV